MSPAICMSGHLCLCEFRGPVTVTMVVTLLSELKRHFAIQRTPLVLILYMTPAAATSVTARSSPFPDVLPALWAYSQEIAIVCESEDGLVDHLRRALCGSVSTPISTLARPLLFFELLDEAFSHAEGVFPHDVLELRRQRLRSGTWGLSADDELKLGNGR